MFQCLKVESWKLKVEIVEYLVYVELTSCKIVYEMKFDIQLIWIVDINSNIEMDSTER
jgi:hypothetical protein